MHNIVINNTYNNKIKSWPKRLSKVWPNWYYGRNDYGRYGTMDGVPAQNAFFTIPISVST